MSGFPAHPPTATTSARRDARLMVIDRAGGTFASRALGELAGALQPGDVLVVNDAATLPASLSGTHARTASAIEVRLLAPVDAGPDPATWQAVLFGAGDWRQRTEDRPPPPSLAAGDLLRLHGADARVEAVSPTLTRLVTIRLLASAGQALSAIYRAGVPVQYSYHRRPLRLWEHQTPLALRPVALEPPSASMHLRWETLLAAKARGVDLVPVTHATGLSSTGDAALDALLPFPERYEVTTSSALRIATALAEGRRVIAVGTGVMRALESAALGGALVPGAGVTSLKITPAHSPRVVAGLLTGMHEQGSSHLGLVASLASSALVASAYEQALAEGFLWHEYGDACLIL